MYSTRLSHFGHFIYLHRFLHGPTCTAFLSVCAVDLRRFRRHNGTALNISLLTGKDSARLIAEILEHRDFVEGMEEVGGGMDCRVIVLLSKTSLTNPTLFAWDVGLSLRIPGDFGEADGTQNVLCPYAI